MLDLIQKASTLACICFYAIEVATDGILATDSAGNKRYVLMYLDDGTVYWQRCKHLEKTR